MMTELLAQAEALEETAALDRVRYYGKLLGSAPPASVLDVGCGNGYAVREWRVRGASAFGVDVSLYRLGRWAAEPVLAELLRVAAAPAPVVVDFPNGSFPVDFWHGDRIGAFRLHKIPDELLPSFADLRAWSRVCRADAVLRPLSGS